MKADNSSVPTPSKNPSKRPRVRCDKNTVAQKVCTVRFICVIFKVIKWTFRPALHTWGKDYLRVFLLSPSWMVCQFVTGQYPLEFHIIGKTTHVHGYLFKSFVCIFFFCWFACFICPQFVSNIAGPSKNLYICRMFGILFYGYLWLVYQTNCLRVQILFYVAFLLCFLLACLLKWRTKPFQTTPDTAEMLQCT